MAYNFSEFQTKLDGVKEWLKNEYMTIRTGQATPAVLDGVKVDAYGSVMPLNQVANIGVEGATSLRISPWDAGQIKDIEKAIRDADLGLSVNMDDKGLRVIFPELTGERRDQLKKVVGQKREEAFVSTRSAREEVWDDLQKQKKAGEITEDDMYRYKEQMEEMVKKVQADLKETEEKKIVEIQA
jgi:ribosome recycling factor